MSLLLHSKRHETEKYAVQQMKKETLIESTVFMSRSFLSRLLERACLFPSITGFTLLKDLMIR